jgi:hypothetical protein
MSYFPNQGQQTSALSQSIVPASDVAQFPTGNVTKKYRTNCDSLPLAQDWSTTTAAGDLLFLGGNCQGASYWVLSKSPFNLGTTSKLDGINTFSMPTEFSFGLHRSLAALNQEFAIQVVDSGTPAAIPAEVAISALSQSTTTLTITTSTAHNLSAGQSFGIYGCEDSRFNYGALVVASVVSSTQVTATAGPGGTIQSLTASPAVLGSAFIYSRRRLGGSSDGTSMIFESATATQASFYVRANSGDSAASNTAAGNHSLTIGTTASAQPIVASGAYSFFPTTKYLLNLQADRVQWHDAAVDAISASSSRYIRDSICPDPSLAFKMRIEATNNKGMTAPVGRIVSVVKTASSTATVTFAEPHGCTVNDYLHGYGVRDQTSFANLTTTGGVKVASIVSATVLTIVWGGAATATSYGGYMSRIQGGAAQNGSISQAIQSATVSGGLISLVGNVTWSGLVIGDTVEVYGCRDSSTGADVGIDGSYIVRNFATTTLTLEAIPGASAPANLSLTNCGGGIIKRTDLRVSNIRAYEYLRERVEFAPRPSTDGSAAIPVNMVTAPSLTITSASMTPSAAYGAGTFHRLLSANTTNLTSVKTTAGTINSLTISNTNASATYFLKIYNKASAPVPGTDTPIHTISLPPGTRSIDTGAYGIRLATGIAYSITGAVADADTTAIPASEVLVNMSYT